jgi:hypothetical protein
MDTCQTLQEYGIACATYECTLPPPADISHTALIVGGSLVGVVLFFVGIIVTILVRKRQGAVDRVPDRVIVEQGEAGDFIEDVSPEILNLGRAISQILQPNLYRFNPPTTPPPSSSPE